MNFNTRRGNLIQTWWFSIDKQIVIAVGILTIFGLWMVMAASGGIIEKRNLPYSYFIQRQIVFVIIGYILMFLISIMPVIAVRRIAILGFFVFFLLLFGVEFFGHEAKGAKRWIVIMGMNFQPSELLKPCFAIFTAWILSRKNSDKKLPADIILIVIFLIIAILLLRQPNLAMLIVTGAIWGTQMLVGGINFILIGFLFISGLGTLFGAYQFLPHVQNRINTFLNSTEAGDNFQTEKSLEAFQNGGTFGTGPASGVIKDIIPDAHTDFIFAVVGEELGMIFCLLVIGLFSWLIFRCMYRAYQEKELFNIIAVSGLSMQLFFQAFTNMGVATNLIPNTGITLPFISYGGSSIISACIVAGLILCLTRKKYG